MILGIDHVLIAVESLESASEVYRRLGFEVLRGGEHPGMGTANALVSLADGAYLELIAVRDRVRAEGLPLTRRVLEALGRENRIACFALDSDDLDADAAALRARGLAIGVPMPGERLRPDGERVLWRLASWPEADLPFLIQDVTPRAVRVPPPAAGLGRAARVASVVIETPQDGVLIDPWRGLLGSDPDAGSTTRWGRGGIRFERGDDGGGAILAIELAVRGLAEHVAGRAEFARRGEGRFEIEPRAAAGARLILVA
jgi:catechol 2,3-dioxygenase-like lactoylglutathione lyase family enzyme